MKVAVFCLSLCVFHSRTSSDTREEAALSVLPNRSQFFQYESVSLSCGQQVISSEWSVKRNTSKDTNEECFKFCGRKYESHCFIADLYPSDTGVYWCEFAAGERSEAVSITVTSGFVILEIPVLPVMEGDDVTLSCRNKIHPSSLTADFYKDGLLIRSSSTGNMTIHSVSESDEGFYTCKVSGDESPDSWLTVRVSEPAAPVMRVCRLIHHVVVGTPYLLSTIVLGLIYRDNRRVALQVIAEDRGHHVVMEVE
ncbi:Fc receptor-like B isoform X1 [Micropterus salmoides]|uniref:Fc receptor-like B isoform X1 n=1 Tax=Micropterus salmoides TaxID=27706 RepID=UPI0018EDE4F8|nr:Fc receptor-like B isoform X1 [Micropterus salmoides]XP_038588271.1 Fc receptor-like B isoform X1 [Micropterus salmoides]